MISIIGLKHDLQFRQNNIDQTAAAVQEENSRAFLPYLEGLLLSKEIQVAGEEGGIGLVLNEFIKERFNCEKTFLQEVIANTGIEYFQFDLPRDQLKIYNIRPNLENILKNKSQVPGEDRERWFYKIISQKIPREANGLIIIGLDHMLNLANVLTSNSYTTKCIDATKFSWYKDPQQAALNNFFNT